MRTFITAAVPVLTGAAAFAAQTPHTDCHASVFPASVEIMHEMPRRAVAPASTKTHTVTLDVDYDLPCMQELSGLFAMESSGHDTAFHYGLSENEGDHVYVFQLPAGSYDFYVGVDLDDFDGTAILTLDDVQVDSDMTLRLAASSAVHRTEITHTAPDGSDLRFSYNGGTVACAHLLEVITHGETLMRVGGISTDNRSLSYVLCNNPESRYQMTRIDVMISPFGTLGMIIPVDFSKSSCGTDADNWHRAEFDFTQTPSKRKTDSYYSEHKGLDYFYTFSTTMATIDDRMLLRAGLGTFDSACPAWNVGVWQPRGYTGRYGIMPVPTGSSVNGGSSSTSATPLRLTPDGLVSTGHNMLPDRDIFLRDGSKAVADGYADLAGIPEGASLGNCAPSLIIMPEEELFEFTFKGRHGENMAQSSDYYTIPSRQHWQDIFGSPLCELRFYRDGVLICDDRNDFPYDTDWGQGDEYRLEITTRDFLIDGETEGFSRSEQTFRTDRGTPTPPTLTSLQIRDASGAINDRPADALDATAVFTAGRFTYRDDNVLKCVYADFEPVECLSVEYAPKGTDGFLPLPFEETGAPVLPGYGNRFIARLDGVTGAAADGWYDLRISIADSHGGTQTQTISPAFRIASHGAVEGIGIGDRDTAIDPADPANVIFRPDGTRAADTSQPGIYIVRTPAGRTAAIRI